MVIFFEFTNAQVPGARSLETFKNISIEHMYGFNSHIVLNLRIRILKKDHPSRVFSSELKKKRRDDGRPFNLLVDGS